LSKLDVNNKITKAEIYSKIEQQYNDLLKDLEKQGLTNELQFVKDNKDEILGIGHYDNSTKEIVDALFDLSEDVDILDLTGENVKSNSKESFENNIADSLSLKVKLLLSGIKDTRFNNQNNFAGFGNIL
jgi:CO dehydrogenase/acetyl-CoA synthase alpha subunit